MRNTFARAVGTTGFALVALGSAIIAAPGCGDQASDSLALDGALSDADAILAAPRFGEDAADGGDGEAGRDNVTREVTLTEDGVVITIDSDDPDRVEKIQERAAHHADRERPDNAPPVEATVENTATGVVVTLSGATEEAVALIQERATRGRDGEHGRHGGRHGRPGGDGERLEGVERTVIETDTGIEIRLESDNAETVEAMQSRNDGEAPERPDGARDDVTVTVEDTENGVLITMTGETDDAIEFLHSRDEQERPRDGGRRGGRGRWQE